jgi:hypothetical protein
MPTDTISNSPASEKIKFSFEFYDLSQDGYCLSEWPPEKIKRALACLKDINTKSFLELQKNKRVYHFDEVIWSRTVMPEGFPDARTHAMSPFHFALVGVNGQLARVFGAYSSGTFYIIWFDLNHEIWPVPLKNT